MRDLTHGTGIDTGLGFAVTADTHPAALDADYGGGTPLSFQVYLRFRPSRMKGMAGDSMGGMKMAMDDARHDARAARQRGPRPAAPAPHTSAANARRQ